MEGTCGHFGVFLGSVYVISGTGMTGVIKKK